MGSYLGRETDPRVKPEWGAQLDPECPLARGIYAHWPLLEGVGAATADLAQGNALGFVGTPAWSPGRYGPAISLPGTNGNYLQTTGPVFDPSAGDWSVAIWFLVTTVSNGPVLVQTNGGGTSQQWLLCTTGGALKSSYGGNLFSANGSITLNTWHHAAYTLAGATQTLYLDGVQAATGTSTRPALGGPQLNIGATNLGAAALSGLVDGVTLARRAWAPGEVLDLFRRPRALLAPLATRRFYYNAGTLGTLAATAGPATFAGSATAVVPEQFIALAATAGPATLAATAAVKDPASLVATAGPATFTGAASAVAGAFVATAGPASFAGSVLATAVGSSTATFGATAGPTTAAMAAGFVAPATLGATAGPATITAALNATITVSFVATAGPATVDCVVVATSGVTVDIRIALRNYLLSDSTIAGLVGEECRPGKRPESDALPAITYTVISNLVEHHLLGSDGQSRARVQFDCWARDISDCVALKARIAEGLDGFIGTLSGLRIVWSKQVGEIDLHEFAADASDRDLYHVAVDYLVRHETPIPQGYTVMQAPAPGASSTTTFPSIAPSGKTLAVVFRDGAGNLANVKSIPGAATISVNGGPPIVLADPVWGATPPAYLPFALFPLATTIKPTDVVTLAVPPGWATTTAGAIADANLAVANEAGGSYLPAFAKGAKAMRLGTNHSAPAYFMSENVYANAMTQASAFGAMDALGYPTKFPASCIVSAPSADPTDPLGIPNAPSDGTWTLVWDGLYAANPTLSAQLATLCQLLADTQGTNNVGHTRTYHITADTTKSHAPTVRLNVAAAGMTNVRVYPPGEATDGSALFGANYVRKATGYQCIRYMDSLHTNASPVVDYSDFPAAGQLSYAFGGFVAGGQVASIDPYTPPDNFFPPSQCAFVVTFTSPHGGKTGQIFNWSGGIAAPNPDNTFPTTTGGTAGPINGSRRLVRVIDDHRLATFLPMKSGSGGTLTQSYPMAAGVTFTCPTQIGMPPDDCVAFSNLVGADAWFSVPHAATDDCVTALAQRIAAELRPGLKCYVEYSNEPWNTLLSFEQIQYFGALARTMPGSGATATATVNSSGVVTGLTLDNPGSGFVMAPAVTIAAGTNPTNTARAHATLIGGTLALVLDRGGVGYDPANPPAVTIDATANPGLAAYTWRAVQVHNLFLAAFTAAGRAGDVVRVMGGQYTVAGATTQVYAQTCAWNGWTYDAQAIAPYINNDFGVGHKEAGLAAAFDRLDADQLHDFTQLAWTYDNFFTLPATHRAALDAQGLTGVVLIGYEGGPDQGVTFGASTVSRSRSWARHPRMRGETTYFLQRLQDAGFALQVDYHLSAVPFSLDNWAKYFARAQVPGAGDGSDGLNDNRADYFDNSRVVSVIGRAYLDWLNL